MHLFSTFQYSTEIAIYWLIAACAIFILGLRSLLKFRKLRSALTLYIGITGVLGSITTFIYLIIIPIYWLSPDLANQPVLVKSTLLAGTVLYYSTLIFQSRVLWYIGFNKKIHYLFLLFPVLIAAIGAFGYLVPTILKQTIAFTNGAISYQVPIEIRVLESIMTTYVVWIGILFIKLAKAAVGQNAKLRLSSIGILYLGGSSIIFYDRLWLAGSEKSVLLYGIYVIAFGFLLLSFIRQKTSDSNNQPQNKQDN